MPDRLELTAAQAGVWFAQHLDPGPAFTTAACVDVDGEIDPVVFERALRRTIADAEALRVRFSDADAVPRQEIVEDPSWTLSVLELDDDALDRWIRADLATPIDLAAGPVFAQALIRRGPGRWTWYQRCHHIVLDAYTYALIANRLAAVYSALIAGADVPGNPFGTLAEVVAEDAAYHASEKRGTDRAFWLSRLAGLDVPDLSSGPSRPGRTFLRHRAILPAEVGRGLTALGGAAKATRVEAVLAATALYVHRLTGAADVVLGLPMMGRLGSVAARVPVTAVNVLPLRLTVHPADTVAELIARVAAEIREIRRHQRYRGEDIRRDLGLVGGERRLTGPWVNIKPFGATLDFGGNPGTPRYVSPGPVDDLSITLDDRGGDRLELAVDANPGRYTETELDGHAARLAGLLATLALTGADTATGRIGLVDSPVVEDTARELPAAGLVELWRAQVARTPQSVALIEPGGASLTHAQLEDRVAALATSLAERGAGPGRIVAVRLPRTAELLVTLLAVQWTGATYLPLDPDFPADRLAWMIEDSDPALVITPGGIETRPSTFSIKDDSAYVLYTSGSTGKPKGVVVTRENLVNFLLAMQAEVPLGGDDRLLAVTTVSFDISGLELYLPLLCGAAVVLAAKESVQDPFVLAELVRSTGATVVQATPTLWRALADVPGGTAALSGLRVLVGGEALPPELAAELRRHAAGVTNLYGPTETTIWSTAHRLTSDDVSVGRPIRNTRAYVLDAALRPVPDGFAGELYLAGAGVARGYLNRAGLTAARFVADPWAPGERMYRTGDLARRRADGTFDVLGRVDHQVKLRGFRIELGEIEAVLESDPGVTRAVAIIREDRPGDRRLVAYVVASPASAGSTLDLDGLRQRAAGVLPDYMVPAAIVAIGALPTTPNGKLDRNALPAPDYAVTAPETARTPEEELLTDIFAEVLGVPSVALREDFFALGGHSLLAARVAARVRTVLSAEVTLRDVFEAPSVAALATRLKPFHRPPLVPHAGAPVMSAAQRRMWFLTQLDGPDATYNLPLALDVDGELDLDALRAALNDLVTRHEPLRTVFTPEPVVLGPDVRLVIEDGDLDAAVREPFDITAEAPLRVRWFPSQSVLLLLVHHIAGDEWSLTPMLDDLATAYAARLAGHRPEWAPLPVRYTDYAAWHNDLPVDVDFWRDNLAGAPEVLRLPTDRPRPAQASAAGDTVTFPIGKDLEEALRRLARDNGVTVFMTLQAAVAALLSRLGAGDDIPLGTPVAGRGDDALERLVGFFVNTVVLRTDVSGDPTFAELLARVRAADLTALAHQDVPFERLVEELNPRRSLGHHPLFQVMVSYQAALPAIAGFPGAEVTPRLVSTGTAKFDLTVDVAERPGGPIGSVEYRTDLFDRETVTAFAHRLVRLLHAVTADPGVAISSVDLLDEAERAPLAGPRRDLAPQTLGDLFTATCAGAPDAAAVEDGGRTLTYAELNALANRLAHRLIAAGAGPERVVATLLPRSADLVVAMLAIAKSGAAILPLDPNHPASRHELQIADADPVLVLTEIGDLPADPGNPKIKINPDSPAYVIYTSGSTGRPKGVVVPHRGLSALVTSVREGFGTGPGTRASQFVSPGVDVAFSEFAATILSGGTLVIVPEDARLGTGLGAFIAGRGLTHVDLPPALLAALPTADLPAGVTVVAGGEAMPADQVRRWSRGRRLINAYGPTETTVTATSWTATAEFSTVLIGRPELNRTAYVLDARLRPVPPGVPGELYLGGDGLARGYLNRPALTAARFVADPFAEPGARMYRTGDLVRRTRTGEIEFLGRTDEQVQLRGFRVEPGEVEAELTAHPAVTQATVVVRDNHLLAYAVSTTTGPELRDHLAARLPAPLVPAAVVVLDALPLTSSGKVDKEALPAAETLTAAGAEPADDAERTLANVFAGLLGLGEQAIGRHDGFFALGGDSILAIQLVSRARVAGLHFAPRQVFEHQTVAALARAAGAAAGSAAVPVESGTGVAPETPIIAWLRGLEAPINRYSQALLLRTPAGANPAEVAAVVEAALAPHDILRARLVTTPEGRWALDVPAGDLSLDLRVVAGDDLAGRTLTEVVSAEREAAADRLDPAAGTMVQAVWFDRGEQPGRLLLVAHHLVVDGVSWRILAEDLATAACGETPAVTGTSFRAWALGVREVAPDREPWQQVTGEPGEGVPARITGRPGERQLDPARDTAGTLRHVTVHVDAAVTGPLLSTVPEIFRAGVQDVLLAGLALALARRSGPHTGTLVGLEGHGREEQVVPGADLVRTVGWFTSEYPVRLPAAAGGPAAVLRGVKEQLRAVPDGGIGYGVLRYLGPGLPLVEPEVLFNYLGRFSVPQEGVDWGLAPELPAAHTVADPRMPVSHRLAVNVTAVDGADGPVLRAEFSYPAAVLGDTEVRRIADDWLAALVALLAAANEPGAGVLTPSDVPLAGLTADDLAELTGRFPDPADVLPLSPLQEGLYYLSDLDQDTDVYTVQQVFTLTGPVDAARLEASAAGLLNRYPNLRGGFTRTAAGTAVQVVPARVTVPFTRVTVDAAGFEALVASERRQRFDLARPPLLRFVLATLGDGDHRLVLTQHHLLMDGWSGPLAMRDLFATYARIGRPRPRPFTDYLAWLKGRDVVAAESAWRTALAGVDEPTLVAPDAPAVVALPEVAEIVLTESDTARLTATARRNGLTLNTVVQGAWALLLAALTGRDDVVFGATVSGRPAELPGVEDMVGLFINTVPVRVRLNPAETWTELLRRVQGEQAALLDHQYLGLAAVQRLAGAGDLFDTLTVFESYPATAGLPRVDGLEIGGGIPVDATHYPLSLVVVPHAALRLRLEHRPDLYDRAAALGILGRFRALLDAFVAGTPPLTARPSGILRDPGPVSEVWPGTVLDEFEAVVRRAPGAVAVRFRSSSLTYGDLAVRVDRLARVLVARGAGPEKVVAVLLPRTEDAIVAWLAVLRAGAIYLPIDVDHPAERIEYLLADASPVVIVTPELLGETAEAQLRVVDPRSGAYLIYTSGSTGRPKGVVVEHASLLNFYRHHREHLIIAGGRTRVALSAALVFDTSWEGILWLIAGHELHLLDDETRRDPALFVDYVRRHRIDFLDVTPSLAGPLADAGLLEGEHRPAMVALGGEAADPRIWQALRDADGVTGVNLYGPTECTVDTLMAWVADSTEPLIGRPIANTRAYVLDSWLRPVLPGVAGELYLSGAQLGRGYLNRPGLTAGRFVADPFQPGERMYRTGDVARWTGDGTLQFVGRADDQVKIRGFRVEPGEVAAALREHPAVRQAAVVAHGGHLVAYVVGEVPGLREWAAERLPDHLVPAVVVELGALPLTVAGKLDRRALPEPDFTGITGGAAPRTATEEILCGLFADVLSLPAVGAADNFFALGGHSLTATALAARVRAVFGNTLPIRAVFDQPTPAALAAYLDRPGAGADLPELTVAERPDPLPLAPTQHRLWLHHQLNGPGPTYNVAFALRLDGPLDRDALRLALDDVLDRHESLRTVFPAVDGRPEQRILDRPEVTWRFGEYSDEALAEAARYGFDLAGELLLRPYLFSDGPDRHVLLLLVHHIVTDEWSEGRLIADLGAAYAARVDGHAPDWSPLPVQYADYAIWQRDLLDRVQDGQLAFWRDALAGIPAELVLPTDRPRPAVPGHRGGIVPFSIDGRTHERIRELARRTGSTAFMVVQAALSALLGRLGAGTDIPLGSPVAGRGDQRLDALAGFFVNTLVLRADLGGDPSFADLVARLRSVDLAAFGNADVPFEKVVEAVNPERSLARNPLFQVMVAVQHVPAETPGLPGLTTSPVPIDTGVAQFDLGVVVTEEDGVSGMRGVVEYSADLFDRATAETFAARFVRLLASAVERPEQRLSSLKVLSAAERDASERDWQGTRVPTVPRTMADLFAAAVQADPAAPALEDGEALLSYAELDRRTNQLARRLIRAGAGPDRIVMVLLPRSAELFVTELAVAKAGGAYLPVDPSYPAERIAGLIADADPVLIVAARGATNLPDGATVLDPADGIGEDDTAITDADRTAALRVEHAAYVIYTSGSTGRPKGVVVPHAGLADLSDTFGEVWRVEPGHRIAQFASPSFDVTVAELAVSLLRGATLVITPEESRLGEDFARFVHERRITHFALPPAALGAVPAGAFPPGVTVISGADRLSPELLARWTATHRLLNAYGPTEATVNSTYGECVAGGPVLIGRPDRNKRAYVLDSALRPVPPGVPGELYLSGSGLARGYLGRAALTAERFVADPFATGERMYRTGDLVRRTPDGQLAFLGRADDQVKIRGFRIEPGEVAAALAEHPDLRHAYVVARDGHLVGYAEGTADPAEVRAWLAHRLPDHLVPAVIVMLDALPLNAAGKVDRDALPEPVVERATERPATVPQEMLATLFAEVLGLDEVGIDEGFFALGGDSIVALQLVSRARAAGLELSARQVFENQTVAALAVVVTPAGGPPAEPAGAGLGAVPITPIQAWLRDQNAPIDTFAQSVVLRVPAALDRDRLVPILQAVLDRHDALRARWTADGLIVPPPGAVDAATLVRAGDRPLDEEHRAAVRRLAPAEGRMLQAVLLPGRLLLTGHHLAVDGVSWRIIAGDLAAAWQGGELPPAGTSLRTWARGLTAAARARAAELPLWESILAAPTASLGGGGTVADQRHHTVRLTAEQTTPLLTTVPDAFHAGVQDVLLTGLALAVRAWRPSVAAHGLLLRLEGHGREEHLVPGSDLTRTVGWFTTEFPVRIDPGGDDPATALKLVKEQVRAIPDAGAGYGMLRYLNPGTASRLASAPQPEILFNYLGRLTASDDGEWVAAEENDTLGDGLDPAFPVAHALEINAATADLPTGPELDIRLSYVAGVLTEADVAELGRHWSGALGRLRDAATGGGGHTPSDLLVELSQDEIDEFEDEWRLQ
ncbi:amino acid adenylation domain-containing protein [Actinoplanes sp. NPDC020271]|uniref:amino acid adenylation domain-containing protein n=1 Tax=Actinoplanes sp. NPDC020271 TaxID=3363896 RepID=UPI0037880CEA